MFWPSSKTDPPDKCDSVDYLEFAVSKMSDTYKGKNNNMEANNGQNMTEEKRIADHTNIISNEKKKNDTAEAMALLLEVSPHKKKIIINITEILKRANSYAHLIKEDGYLEDP